VILQSKLLLQFVMHIGIARFACPQKVHLLTVKSIEWQERAPARERHLVVMGLCVSEEETQLQVWKLVSDARTSFQ
jgi:hypothetical protein